ncbi:hypothetical protein R3P38DRAFT_3217785 [Favolaschia claudopus]|uniref:Uncharacterized protein n=1 Tax=Favolaschia claudopus TaxID=2862362 RepID=A0AAW0A4S9_9AGAR
MSGLAINRATTATVAQRLQELAEEVGCWWSSVEDIMKYKEEAEIEHPSALFFGVVLGEYTGVYKRYVDLGLPKFYYPDTEEASYIEDAFERQYKNMQEFDLGVLLKHEDRPGYFMTLPRGREDAPAPLGDMVILGVKTRYHVMTETLRVDVHSVVKMDL